MARQNEVEPKIPHDAVLGLMVYLRDIEPVIWRRIEVRASIMLPKLHMVIQGAFGWTNSHLHDFNIDDKEYGEEDEFGELATIDEHYVKLCNVLTPTSTGFGYRYDLGDCWQHDVQIAHISAKQSNTAYPVCTAGARRCPPENCGGASGYMRLLKLLPNPQHAEYESAMEWVGGKFDPDEFDLAIANQRLKRFARLKIRDNSNSM